MLVPHIIEKPTSLIPTPAKMVILGSTGSIGRSALDVVRSNRERFEVLALSAHKNSELLLEQASEFKPRYAVFGEMQDNLEWACGATEFLSGSEALLDIAALPDADIVLAAIVGHAGLRPLLAALQSGKRVALANKESLVAAGELVRAAVEKSGAQIIPVDSEHSAIFQAIQGVHTKEISRLVLTASGGPFLNRDIATLCRVTPEEAVKHPRWNMGAKISIDSATLANKGLELIEAHFLFGMAPDKIDVIIHPESIIHSFVDLIDGTSLAQLSYPDMRAPIANALTYPGERLKEVIARLDYNSLTGLSFFPLLPKRFPLFGLAKRSLSAAGAMPAIYNAANEFAVNAFMHKRISFDKIVGVCDTALTRFDGSKYRSLEELLHLIDLVNIFLSEKI